MLNRIYRLFRLNPYNTDDRNAWYLIIEMFWVTMLSSASTFNAAFAIHLGASNTTVSLLTSLPALLAMLVSIPAGHFLNTRSRRKPWLMWSLGIHRAGYLLVALAPLIHLFNIPSGTLVVLIIVLVTIPAHFFNVGFIPMLTEVIPEKKRTGVFTARNVIYNATFSIVVALFGLWLDRVIFPLNYQVMYVFGVACSFISIYYLVKVQAPDSPVFKQIEQTSNPVPKKRGLLNTHGLHQRSSFLRMTANTMLHSVGLWAASPLYVLYYVRILGASDGWLGLMGTISSLSTIFGFLFWRWLIHYWGESNTLKRTIVLAGLFPVLVGLMPSLTLIPFAIALNGLISPGISLSHLNTLMKVIPEENRPGYYALYTTIANFGAFLLPFAGIALANRFGFAPVLIACGLGSVIGSTSFWWWPVIHPETASQPAGLVSPTADQ